MAFYTENRVGSHLHGVSVDLSSDRCSNWRLPEELVCSHPRCHVASDTLWCQLSAGLQGHAGVQFQKWSLCPAQPLPSWVTLGSFLAWQVTFPIWKVVCADAPLKGTVLG